VTICATKSPSALLEALEGAAHVLPGQGPIGVFVHHNTLHAFEDRPFEEAVLEAARLFGAEPFPAEDEQRRAFERGRILERDLEAVLRDELGGRADEPLVGGVTRLELRRLALFHAREESSEAALEWQLDEGVLLRELGTRADELELRRLFAACRDLLRPEPQPQPPPARLRDALLHATGQDVDAFVHPTLIHVVSAFLDQGLAYWPMPGRERGLYVAARDLLGQPAPPPNAWVRRSVSEMQRQARLDLGARDVTLEILEDLGLATEAWQGFLQSTLLALPGWAGMVRQLELRPDRAPVEAPPASLLDFVALRLTLEREASRFIAARHGLPHESLSELWQSVRTVRAPDANGALHALTPFLILAHAGIGAADLRLLDAEARRELATELHAMGSFERRRVWQLAFERRHAQGVLSALAAHFESPPPPPTSPQFQAVFCIDERSESLRRHLEELAPEVETWGTPGFFGVAMYYRGLDDAHAVPLCPVNIRPAHQVSEQPVPGATQRFERRRARRRIAGRLSRGADVGSRTFVRGTLWSAAVGVLSAVPLVLRVLWPRASARFGHSIRQLSVPALETTLELGFEVNEKADIVASVLEEMGLRAFTSLVLVIGHGSSSLNNPHESAHDCGACGGGRGGPNARAFALMANDAEVRGLLAERGLAIPDETVFVAGYHDTCNDSVTLYDLKKLSPATRERVDEVVVLLERARARDAHERVRRFESASTSGSPSEALRHVEARAVDLAQPRPEYGHATNAMAFVGRRSRTRGLFLDRRAFLVSYDPTHDPTGALLQRVIASVVPVGAGINLEYYFSYVDPIRFGSGTKLPHNITGLVGVMDGYSSDLRTGLPWQMVEIHEPVRLLTIVEAKPEVLVEAVSALPAVARLVQNRWLRVVALDPDSSEMFEHRNGRFERFVPEALELPTAPTSRAWYSGRRGPLPVARVGVA
jgi:uncharacterized protein YbcC (UPF0753/DUF2309 family)